MRGALRHEVEGGEHAPEAGIGGQRADERLRGDDLVGEFLQLVGRKEQQPLAAKEVAAFGIAHRLEQRRQSHELLGQPIGRAGGEFGGLAVDHDDEKIDVLRKRAVHLGFALAPRDA